MRDLPWRHNAVRTYRPGFGPRFVNRYYRRLARRARGPETLHVLSVPGRASGRLRRVPLRVITYRGERYLVAIYGEHAWVRNVRANGLRARLERGGESRPVELTEVDAAEAARVIEQYANVIPHVRPYLDLPPTPEQADWIRLASTHPVFRIRPQRARDDWPWQESLEGPVAAPDSHRVLLDVPAARVLEVEIAPGEREPVHTHRRPSLMIVDEPARIRYYANGVLTAESDERSTAEPIVMWLDPEGPHEVENVDNRRYHAYRIELQRERRDSNPRPPA